MAASDLARWQHWPNGGLHHVAADRQIDERVGSAADQAASARGLAVRPEAIGVAPRAAPFDWC